jgi:hypothetical protein
MPDPCRRRSTIVDRREGVKTRVVLIGDVGGCHDELTRALRALGDDADTVVIQVGDLVA